MLSNFLNARKWHSILPKPYCNEMPVVVFVLPPNWRFSEGTTKDEEYNVLVCQNPDETKLLGLQIVDVDIPKYMDQRNKFAEYEVQMATPEYIGPISTLPQDILLDDNQIIVLPRDEMWRSPINLKKVWKQQPPEKRC